jgi:hypothetical protein
VWVNGNDENCYEYRCSPCWCIIKTTRDNIYVIKSLRITVHGCAVAQLYSFGRAMPQAVSRRPVTAEARVRSRVSPCGICGGQSGTGTGFFPSTSVFPCQFLSTGAPLHGKTRKEHLIIIFITGLHSKPQGCGASRSICCGALNHPSSREISEGRKCYFNALSKRGP